MSDGIPAPNSIYKIPIKNVTGNANVKIQTKNLLNINRELGAPSNTAFANTTKRLFDFDTYVKGITGANNYSSSNVTDAVIENNKISFKVVAAYYGLGLPIKVKPNFNYYLSKTALSSNSITIVSFYDKEGTYISNSASSSFTTPANCDFILLVLTGSTANATYSFSNIQLEQGTTATSYVPHEEQNYPFTFEEGQFLADSEELKENGMYKKYAQVDLSTLTWLTVGTNKYRTTDLEDIIKIPASTTTKPNIYAEKYYGVTSATSLNISGQLAILSTGEVYIYDTTGTPSGILQYELAEPITIPYNSTQQAQYEAIKNATTYKGTTYIEATSSELPPLLEIQYWKEKGSE